MENIRDCRRTSLLGIAGLWITSLLLYAPLIGRWAMSGDEFYTYEDSTFSIPKMLSFNSRPLYFIVCHYLLKWFPSWPVEFTIRFPAMLASSCIAPCLYGMLRSTPYARVGWIAAILAMFNPWVMQMSQFGRYYAFVMLFASVTTIAAFRAMQGNGRIFWSFVVMVAGVLATLSHPPALLLIPASVAAWIAVGFVRNAKATIGFLRMYGIAIVIAACLAAGVGLYFLQDVLREWSSASKSQFGGGYGLKTIAMSLAILGGLSTWSLAILPMIRLPKDWSDSEVFLSVFLLGCVVPLLLLLPIGGGVSSRYMLFCLPSMFLLAGIHGNQLYQHLPSWGHRIGLACVVLGCNVPLLLSIAANGNHFDYRAMARQIETLDLPDPIIYSSNHRLLDYYLDDRFQVMPNDEDELGEFATGLPKDRIERGIDLARSQRRPLLLVSRQDRQPLEASDAAWLYDRFAVLRTVETPRYDHRRQRVILYQYRPTPNASRTMTHDDYPVSRRAG